MIMRHISVTQLRNKFASMAAVDRYLRARVEYSRAGVYRCEEHMQRDYDHPQCFTVSGYIDLPTFMFKKGE